MSGAGLVVLSLFDGMSCGQLALARLGVKVAKYFASEIDKHAIKVTQDNFPDTIQIGDVRKVTYSGGVLYTEKGDYVVGEVDLLLAGSPCQGFSSVGKQLHFDDERSKLYFEFERLKNEIKPKWFLLENVKMKAVYREIISERLGVPPVTINSRLLSAQNRLRLYWSNLSITEPPDLGISLVDILEENVDEKYFVKAGRLSWLKTFGELKEKNGYVAFNPDKAKCLTVRGEPSWNCTYILQWPRDTNAGGLQGVGGKVPCLPPSSWPANNLLLNEGLIRKLTPVECERLQTVPDNYTQCVADTHRYAMLGNGWTIDVIAHILRPLAEEFRV